MSEFKASLNLPTTDFAMKSSPAAEESRLLKWENVPFQEGDYVLHDGPPFANGDIHLGHVLNKVLKDIDMRFRRLDGKHVRYQPGWDCHGLPIENKVKKELKPHDLGASKDADVLKYACSLEADKWMKIQRNQFRRLGIEGDWDNPYYTMHPDYETNVVSAWNQLKEKGLTYKANRPVHWSVENRTSLALAELEYKVIKQTTAFVSFPTPEGEHLLIWTTTPWSLPGNTAIAVNPDINYDLVDSFYKKYWVSQTSVKPMGSKVIKTLKGRDLVGMLYTNPLTVKQYKVVAADFVTDSTGTGLVHIAPAHGKDDFNLAKEAGLEVINPLDTNAVYNSVVPMLEGLNVWKGEQLIRKYLGENGYLYNEYELEHEYPHDWRSGKPTITIATEQSFVAMDKPFDNGPSLRERALKALDDVEFINPNGKAKLSQLIAERPDWCVSRQRQWGIQIPNETDIFDVWFESGCSWMVHPSPNATYLEGVDQYRGWFQHSLLLAVALTGKAPFKRVVDHGFIVGPDGRKLSKSDPNYVPATETINQIGSEAVRLWVSSNDFSKDVSVSPKMLKEFVNNKYNKVRNTFRYLISNLEDYDKDFVIDADPASLDGWMRHKANELMKSAFEAYDKYEYHRVFHMLLNFCVNDFSAVYANAMKDRLYCDAKYSLRRHRALTTMMHVYLTLSKIIYPVLPLLSEEVNEKIEDDNAVYLNFVDGESDTWKTLLKLRDDALLQLDHLKKEKGLNKATDAEAVFYLLEPEKYAHYQNDLEDMVGVGYHTVVDANEDRVEVIDRRNDYPVCERSWKRRPDVVNGLSIRDAEVMKAFKGN